MKIVRLESENVKRLNAIEITPEGNLIVIGGKNEAGKSSVLDSIEYGLARGDCLPPMPIRKGQKKGHVVVDLGDIVVHRFFKEGRRPELEIRNKEGALFDKSPQEILDRMMGRLSFDPLEFSRMKNPEQVKILMNIAGLDFTAIDTERKKVFDERTLINRDWKALKARLDAIPDIEAPSEEIRVADLTEELERRIEVNQGFQKRRNGLKELTDSIPGYQKLINDRERQIAELQKRIDDLMQQIHSVTSQMQQKISEQVEMELAVSKLFDLPLEDTRQQIKEAEEKNRLIRQKKDRASKSKELESIQKKVDAQTARLEEIDAEKEQQLSEAKFPLPGMSFSDEGITINDIPLSQCSSAQQLRISVGVGKALNPTLKIMLIRDGSLLDEDNLALVAREAEEWDGQIWLERVGEGKECSVIIEDGGVKK